MPLARTAPLGLLVLLAIGTGATAASASTISGSLGGGKLPAKGKGVASVRAVGASSGVIVADDRLTSTRFKLTLPAGSYVLFAASSPLKGHAGVDRIASRTIKIRKGRKHRVRLSLKKLKRKARPASATTFVPVSYPAVWVRHFGVSGPKSLAPYGKAVSDLLITDLISTVGPACNGVVVERDRIADVIAELKLQQGPGFDPGSKVPLGHFIAHNRIVSGRFAVSGSAATITATVKNTKTGRTRTITHTGTANGLFALEQSMVQEVTDAICATDVTIDMTAQLTHTQIGLYTATATTTAHVAAESVSSLAWSTPQQGVTFTVTQAAITGADPNCAVAFQRMEQPPALPMIATRLPNGGYTVNLYPSMLMHYDACGLSQIAHMGGAWVFQNNNPLVTTPGPGVAGSRTLTADDPGLSHDAVTVTVKVTPE